MIWHTQNFSLHESDYSTEQICIYFDAFFFSSYWAPEYCPNRWLIYIYWKYVKNSLIPTYHLVWRWFNRWLLIFNDILMMYKDTLHVKPNVCLTTIQIGGCSLWYLFRAEGAGSLQEAISILKKKKKKKLLSGNEWSDNHVPFREIMRNLHGLHGFTCTWLEFRSNLWNLWSLSRNSLLQLIKAHAQLAQIKKLNLSQNAFFSQWLIPEWKPVIMSTCWPIYV